MLLQNFVRLTRLKSVMQGRWGLPFSVLPKLESDISHRSATDSSSASLAVGLSVFLLLGPVPSAAAFDYEWNRPAASGVGNLLDPGNWNPGGLPGSGDTAIIGNGGSASIFTGDTVTYNTLRLGTTATGSLLIDGGQVNIVNEIAVGQSSAGSLTVSGGTLDIGTAFGLVVGKNSAQGTLTQTDGYIGDPNGTFYLGHDNGSFGTWNQSGGTAEARWLWIRHGHMNQSAGQMTIHPNHSFSNVKLYSADSAYTLSGTGQLTTPSLDLDTGLYLQTGGALTTGEIIVDAPATVRYSGGTMDVGNLMTVAGTLDFDHAAVAINVGSVNTASTVNLSAGQIQDGTNATINILGDNSFAILAAGNWQPSARSTTPARRTPSATP
jgi:hypothetical protein